MRSKKSFAFIIFIVLLSILLTSCSNTPESNINNIDEENDVTVLKSNTPGYLLTSSKGDISYFNMDGVMIDELKLGGNNSDFIFTVDNGTIYHKKMNKVKNNHMVLYAVDKNRGQLDVLRVTDEKIELIGNKSLRNSDSITDLYAYNGKFFYSFIGKNIVARNHTFSKPEKEKENGIIDYNATLPFSRNSNEKTYIIVEDVVEEFKEAKDNGMTDEEYAEADIKSFKRQILEIPYELDSWTASNENIYFFLDSFMGQYKLNKDQISLYYGPKKVVESRYIDGSNSKVIAFANNGENSTKSIFMEMEPKFMQVTKAIEIPEPLSVSMDIDKPNHIYSVYKNPVESTNTLSKVIVSKYNSYENTHHFPASYVATKIIARNGHIVLFNPFEDYVLYKKLQDEKFINYKKAKDENTGAKDYNDIFMVDLSYISDFDYDSKGNLVINNKPVNKDGLNIDSFGQPINKYGQKLNEYGKAVNDNGDFIDRFNNIIDKNGNIIEYVKGEDGYYRNKLGEFVNSKGEKLIQNKQGEWVEPIKEERPEIEGYYDENGKFIINPEYLEKYPDAHNYLNSELLDKGDAEKERIEKEENKIDYKIKRDIKDKNKKNND